MENITDRQLEHIHKYTSNEHFHPEEYNDTHPIIGVICHWVLDLEHYAKEIHERQHCKLNEKVSETKMPMGSWLHLTNKLKKLGHFYHTRHELER